MKQEGIWHKKKAFYRGGTDWMFQPAQDRGQRARWKAVGSAGGSSSPDPESGEQWTPFGKVNLVPGGKKTQGDQKPSAVLSADICLSMCLSLALCVCVCAGIVSGLVVFWCIVLFSLF